MEVATLTTTTSMIEVTTYTMTIDLDLGLPENMTTETLVTNTSFATNVQESLAKALGIKPAQVVIKSLEFVARRLREASGPSPGRRLLNSKLQVDYEVVASAAEEGEIIKKRIQEMTNSSSSTQTNFTS